jgi:hypothetical protein
MLHLYAALAENTVGDFKQALCDMAASDDTHLANGFCQPPRPVGARGG